MEPDNVPEPRSWLTKIRVGAAAIRTGLHRLWKRIAASVAGGLTGGALITQSAYAQSEGFAAVAEEFCVGTVASVTSTAYYGLGLALIIYGLLTFMSPKKDNNMSRGETRSAKMKGASMMALGIVSPAFPVILAGLGWVDLNSCISPGNVGSS